MSKIKICGMMRSEDIEIVNELTPDFVGFVFSSIDGRFRRQVSVSKAERMRSSLKTSIKAVGVFVDEPIEFIERICEDDIIDVVQLHGNEKAEYILELSRTVKTPIIKAVHVKSAEQIYEAEKLPCQYLLLDTAYKDKVGGGGKKFNWDIIPDDIKKPFFLAGGLNAENISDALKKVNPYCIDLSSSVETNGFKDREKVKEVIKKARKLEERL
ncbi:MAG: phosphoribosylanthranilate isomerase [Ruminococcus sp.]|nr:phosphoribosylanthranilate isomerase [Ruminococcus sp.]